MTETDHLIVQALALVIQDAPKDAAILALVIKGGLDDDPVFQSTSPVFDIPFRSETLLLLHSISGPRLWGVDPVEPNAALHLDVETKIQSYVDGVAIHDTIYYCSVMKQIPATHGLTSG